MAYTKKQVQFLVERLDSKQTKKHTQQAFNKHFGTDKSFISIRLKMNRLASEGLTGDVRAAVLRDLIYIVKRLGIVPTKLRFLKETQTSNKRLDHFESYETLCDIAQEAQPEVFKGIDREPEPDSEEEVDVLAEFIAVTKTLGFTPKQSKFIKLTGITTHHIKKVYGDYENLITLAKETAPDVFAGFVDETSFTPESFQKLGAECRRSNVFFITTAVTGAPVFGPGMDAVSTFCKARDAKLLVLPCADPATTRESQHEFQLDSNIPQSSVVFKDLSLNENVFLSAIKLSAKHINPLTGLARIGTRRGSFLYASPKQALEYVATQDSKSARASMTTAAITLPIYNSSYYMSNRTDYLANLDHVLGGIIVEVVNNRRFHFRQVQFNPINGDFYDLGKKYCSNGVVLDARAELAQLPDTHVGSTDPKALYAFKKIVELVKPKYLTTEDFFDGSSINHHELLDVTTRAQKAALGQLSLQEEIAMCGRAYDSLAEWPVEQIICKYGNHEDFLSRWIKSGAYTRPEQAQNHRLGLHLALALYEEKLPLEHALRVGYGLKQPDKFRFLRLDESFSIDGIENGVHGDVGPSGTRNPGLAGLEKAYSACNTGHTHTPGILRGAFRVGTGTYLKLPYNKGPSAWAHTMLVQYPGGYRQLINSIDGDYPCF